MVTPSPFHHVELGRDFPQLKTCATLSPVPGVGEWLMNRDDPLTLDDHPTAIRKIIEKLRVRQPPEPLIGPVLQRELSRLCAYYLMYAQRGDWINLGEPEGDMKASVFIATSLDGFIARQDGAQPTTPGALAPLSGRV